MFIPLTQILLYLLKLEKSDITPKSSWAKSMQGTRCRKHGNSSFPVTVAVMRAYHGTNPAISIQDTARLQDEGTEAALQQPENASSRHKGLVLNKN